MFWEQSPEVNHLGGDSPILIDQSPIDMSIHKIGRAEAAALHIE
jgi:hypothetical protein